MNLPHPLAEEEVAGLWCVAYGEDALSVLSDGVDVIAYAMRGGIPDLRRCTFAARRRDGRWLVTVVGGTQGRLARALGSWADWVCLRAQAQAVARGCSGSARGTEPTENGP
jgi:hypothetical protein